MNDLNDSSWLCNFVVDCRLPETVQVVDGYESLDSEELSWCQDDIVNLHTLKEESRIIARDVNGNHFSIPLTYPGKIFEIIPMGCADRYETVEELLVPFPKYVRSLRDMPKTDVAVGGVIELLEPSQNGRGLKQIKCRVTGSTRTILLSGNQLGPFETLRNASPICIKDVLNQTPLPTRVRVLTGKAKAFNECNTNPLVPFEGLFVLEQAVKQKILIVSTMVEKQLRILKMPIDLEITVKRAKLNIHPNVFSQICHLIESEVNINSTITCGITGDASWYFDNISDDLYGKLESDNNEFYEELRPLLPPRTVSGGLPSKRNGINNKKAEVRYAPPPKPKLLGKPSGPAVQTPGNIMLAAPPRPAAKKPMQPNSPKPPRPETITAKRNTSSQCVSQSGREPDSAPRHEAGSPKAPGAEKMAVQRDGKEAMARLLEKVDTKANANLEEQEGREDTYETISEVLSKQQSGPVSEDTLAKASPHQIASKQQDDPAAEFRKSLQNLSVSEVSEWLIKLGLNQYVKLFVKEDVDGTMLLEMDDEMMQCIGIVNALHRKKLLMFIQRGWTPKRN